MPQNCWEVKNCGRQPGGEHVEALGVCPATTQTRCHGANRGSNGGRACWLVSGTLCGGEVQGQFAQKLASCADCEFYKQVHEEEGAACQSNSEILLSLGDPAQLVQAYEELRSMHAKLKETQAQLVQLRKLEAVGQLAAGLAHEINTPTQFIGDNLVFLKESVGPLLAAAQASTQILNAAKAAAELIPQVHPALDGEEVAFLAQNIPQAIDQSLDGVRRVATIVRALKEFCRPVSAEKIAIDVHRAIENTIEVARGEWKDVAEVRTDFDLSLPTVPCFPDEFNQTIFNLLINAAQAIRSTGKESGRKGMVTIGTRQNADWVEIRISDTGPGIPKAIQHRIFDPFFTTQEVGKGTGQGLYVAYQSVVKKHGGTLSFESPPSQGTTFVIRLPLSQSVAKAADSAV